MWGSSPFDELRTSGHFVPFAPVVDTGKLVEQGPRCETPCQWLELRPQGNVQAIGDKGHEYVCFDAALDLVGDAWRVSRYLP